MLPLVVVAQPVVLALESLQQEDQEFKARLGYIGRL
jgi:hypothetical protein